MLSSVRPRHLFLFSCVVMLVVAMMGLPGVARAAARPRTAATKTGPVSVA